MEREQSIFFARWVGSFQVKGDSKQADSLIFSEWGTSDKRTATGQITKSEKTSSQTNQQQRFAFLSVKWQGSNKQDIFLPAAKAMLYTVKSRNYDSRNNDTSQKYNRIIDDSVMEVSIE